MESDEEVMREVGQPMMQMALGDQKTRIISCNVAHTQLLRREHELLRALEQEGNEYFA